MKKDISLFSDEELIIEISKRKEKNKGTFVIIDGKKYIFNCPSCGSNVILSSHITTRAIDYIYTDGKYADYSENESIFFEEVPNTFYCGGPAMYPKDLKKFECSYHLIDKQGDSILSTNDLYYFLVEEKDKCLKLVEE